MIITSFNPMILSENADEVIKLFEELGFERRHTKTGIHDGDITGVDMKYTGEDGKAFRVTVVQCPVPQDITTIRMNVRDLDEAYQMLEKKGFKNVNGENITDTGSSKATMMVSPSGFSISIAEHIKND